MLRAFLTFCAIFGLVGLGTAHGQGTTPRQPFRTAFMYANVDCGPPGKSRRQRYVSQVFGYCPAEISKPQLLTDAKMDFERAVGAECGKPFNVSFQVVDAHDTHESAEIARVASLKEPGYVDHVSYYAALDYYSSKCASREFYGAETSEPTTNGKPCPVRSGDPRFGYTPLMIAARTGDIVGVKELVACGSDVNAAAKDGYTALMFAAQSGVVESAEILLKAGARVNARQDGGVTALGIASDAWPPMVQLLRKHGATQ